MAGRVYLVGGGPGDPGLFTLRGKAVLQKADVIVYDALVNTELLSFAPEKAEKIFVGKRRGWHSLSQEKIGALLIEKALAGYCVVRLKGGDPFLFGRGGEEAEVLVEAGISFEVLPGVSSALAVPAYAGIPLTHRSKNRMVIFCTGHEAKKGAAPLDFSLLAKAKATLVFLMSRGFLAQNCQNLLKEGMSPDTPAAVIEWGTFPGQKTLKAPLADISNRCDQEKIKAPAIFIVGEVVDLQEKLSWFEKKPLFGKRIVVTREKEQAKDLVDSLTTLGADVIHMPTISFTPLPIPKNESSFDSLKKYHWILFTSVNTVRFFFQTLLKRKLDARAFANAKIAAIGQATENELKFFGVFADVLPEESNAEGLLDTLPQTLSQKKILLPRAKKAREILPETLRQRGAEVEVLPLYETVLPPAQKRGTTFWSTLDAITFTSPSTVDNFLALYPDAIDFFDQIQLLAIGPVTKNSLEQKGTFRVITAPFASQEGLIQALLTSVL